MRGIAWRAAWAGIGLLASAAAGEAWKEPGGAFSCDVPAGWAVARAEEGKVMLKESKVPPAFLNVRWKDRAAAKDLDAFVEAELQALAVKPTRSEPCELKGRKAVRAAGPVSAAGFPLLDLFLFVQSGDRYYTVVLTCLPRDEDAYAKVLDAFMKGLELSDKEEKEEGR